MEIFLSEKTILMLFQNEKIAEDFRKWVQNRMKIPCERTGSAVIPESIPQVWETKPDIFAYRVYIKYLEELLNSNS